MNNVWETNSKLKPCPFCGNKPEIFNKTSLEFTDEEPDNIWDIRCGTIGCYLENGADRYEFANDVTKMWNERAESKEAETIKWVKR